MSADEYNPETARAGEKLRGFLLLNTSPERPGRQARLIESAEDLGLYYEGVLVALDLMQTTAVDIRTDTWQDAMQTGDQHAQRIFMEASEDVARAREGISLTAKHAVALLAAKLELEAKLGELPYQADVKRRARELFRVKFNQEPYQAEDSRAWRDAMRKAGLTYLKEKRSRGG